MPFAPRSVRRTIGSRPPSLRKFGPDRPKGEIVVAGVRLGSVRPARGAGRRYNAAAAFLRGRFARARHYLAGMAHDNVYEVPLFVRARRARRRSALQKLRVVHGEARFELAPELVAATRTARLHKL
jgi:hypothetical protein